MDIKELLKGVFKTNPEFAAAALTQLTPRQREVAELVANGVGNDTIAKMLAISTKTLDFYRMEIKRKLKVESMTGVPRIVLAARILAVFTPPDPNKIAR